MFGQVGGQAVLSRLGLAQIHPHQWLQHGGVEPQQLAVLDLGVERPVLVQPQDVVVRVAARLVVGQVDCVELVRGVGPHPAVRKCRKSERKTMGLRE